MMQSDLENSLGAYLVMREGLKYSTRNIRGILQSLIVHLTQHCTQVVSIKAQSVIDWACSGSPSASTQCVRLSVARGFLTYLKVNYSDIEIPSRRLIQKPQRPHPFIFSPEDLQKLLKAAHRLKLRKYHRRLEPETLRTLLSLLACTGLRPSEAIKLTLADVQLDDPKPHLLIRCTKFHKWRLVPVHVSAVQPLKDYLKWRMARKRAKQTNAFFIATHPDSVSTLTYQTLLRNFHELVKLGDIQVKPGQLRPTLHSLRHTFAVERLRHWYEEGEDVHALVPNLSIFLGHSELASSYWYLSATPELMSAAAKRFECYAQEGGANEE